MKKEEGGGGGGGGGGRGIISSITIAKYRACHRRTRRPRHLHRKSIDVPHTLFTSPIGLRPNISFDTLGKGSATLTRTQN